MKHHCASLFLLLLGGCATYQDRPIAPASELAAFEARSLDNPKLQQLIAAQLPEQGSTWGLPKLTLAAYYYSQDLALARAKWASSDAAVISAGQRPNPLLTLPTQYTASASSPWTYGFGIDVPIETAGKRGYRVAQAESRASAAQLAIEQVAWQIRSRIRSGMATLAAAQKKSMVLQQQLQSQQAIVDMLMRRLAAGSVSSAEVSVESLRLIQCRADLATSEVSAAEAKGQIAAAIGIAVGALQQHEIDLQAFTQTQVEVPALDARHQATLHRADFLAALADYQASQENLQLAIAKQYPNFSLGSGFSWDQGQHKYQLSLSSIELPIFNQNQGPIAEAEAQRQEAAAKVNALQAQAIGDSDAAFERYRSASENLSLMDTLVTGQGAELLALRDGFAKGATDRLAVAQGERNAMLATLARLDAQAQFQQAVGALEDALQQPLPSLAKGQRLK